MTVTCSNCGKSLKVKDEWAGKMIKCPQCKSTFRVDPGGKSAPSALGKAAVGKPGKPMPKPGAKPEKKGGGLAINWGMIVMLALLALIPIGIALFMLGPMRVKSQWEAKQDQVHNDVTDVAEFAMKALASKEGDWNPNESHGSPTIGEVRLLPNIFSMSLPKTVKFDGYCSTGRFDGEYTLETGEVDMTLKTGGTMLPSGLYSDEEGTIMPGGQRESRPAGMPGKGGKLTPHHITGRSKNGAPSCEIDGKKAEIYYPPKIGDDGEPEKPADDKKPAQGSKKN